MGRILLGVFLAIACTTALDASGYTAFSALPLIPLFALLAMLGRIPRAELGLRTGPFSSYVAALAHPIIVCSVLVALALGAHAVDFSAFDASKAVRNVALMAAATFVLAIITEEGFFRGWLWAALGRQHAPPLIILGATTAAFVLWHVSWVYLSGDFHFGTAQIPLFFVNATLLGLIWGLLRLGSGSIIVSSAGHGLWNGMAYVLFGVGSNVGALGIRNLALYGLEVGLFGALLNAGFAGLLLFLLRGQLGTLRAGELATSD